MFHPGVSWTREQFRNRRLGGFRRRPQRVDPGAAGPAVRLRCRRRSGAAPRPPPPQPDGRHSRPAHRAQGQGGGARRPGRRGHGDDRAAEQSPARQPGRLAHADPDRARAFRAALGGSAVRIDRRRVPGARDRRGTFRLGHRRRDGREGDQENGRDRDRAGPEELAIRRHARRRAADRPSRLRAAAARDPRSAADARRGQPAVSAAEQERFEALLRFLQQQRGFDFTGYKRPSVMRRMLRRMQTVGLASFEAYRDYLEVHPEEFAPLFNTILINVTSFFRDPPAWEFVEKQVLPKVLSSKAPQTPVRVWSAGCASGQEAYSIAMLFAEALGEDAFRERVKVYATDADEEALTQARQAAYGPKDMEDVPPQLRERYFEQLNGRYVFRTDLRRSVIFGRHDLVQDAPISGLDLLVCRNTLMYFNAETQAKVMSRFHFALNGQDHGGGYLFLGRAEMLLTQSSLFAPLDLKCRVFEKVAYGARRRAPALGAAGPNDNGVHMNRDQRLRELALEEIPLARIIIDSEGTLVQATQKARLLFTLNPKDIGRPLQDLEISYRPTELRSLIEQAYGERRPITQTSVERRFTDGESQYLDVTVQPLYDESRMPLGVSVTFVDVTHNHKLLDELQRSREEIQTANEELQSSNEELETTNEELQSSNEELETTNEELQSTNEELETMNEELQSTNEELQTVNEELRQRSDELNHLNAFLESVLASLPGGAAVIDPNYNVLMWNQRAEDLWGLRSDEVRGRSFLGLDIGLPVSDLRSPIRACLTGEADAREVTVEATNRRGKRIRCSVVCTPLLSPSRKREGVILTMDEMA